jgi:hypothetical protein
MDKKKDCLKYYFETASVSFLFLQNNLRCLS